MAARSRQLRSAGRGQLGARRPQTGQAMQSVPPTFGGDPATTQALAGVRSRTRSHGRVADISPLSNYPTALPPAAPARPSLQARQQHLMGVGKPLAGMNAAHGAYTPGTTLPSGTRVERDASGNIALVGARAWAARQAAKQPAAPARSPVVAQRPTAAPTMPTPSIAARVPRTRMPVQAQRPLTADRALASPGPRSPVVAARPTPKPLRAPVTAEIPASPNNGIMGPLGKAGMLGAIAFRRTSTEPE